MINSRIAPATASVVFELVGAALKFVNEWELESLPIPAMAPPLSFFFLRDDDVCPCVPVAVAPKLDELELAVDTDCV